MTEKEKEAAREKNWSALPEDVREDVRKYVHGHFEFKEEEEEPDA